MTKRNEISALVLMSVLGGTASQQTAGWQQPSQADQTTPAPAEAQPPETQITNAPIRDEPESAVSLVFYSQGEATTACTGVVLSRYWLVTAAHCVRNEVARDGVFAHNRLTIRYGVDGTANGPNISYFRGAASFYMHPHYDGSEDDYDDDLALIRLYENGMTVFTPATIMAETSRCYGPDTIGHPRVTGYGRGTPRSGDKACPDDIHESGWKRSGQFMASPACPFPSGEWSPGSPFRLAVTVDSSQRTVCPGDSGGPIYWKYDGRDVVAAVLAYDQIVVWNDKQRGTSIRRKLDWIIDMSRQKQPVLTCTPGHSNVGPDWWTCVDDGQP